MLLHSQDISILNSMLVLKSSVLHVLGNCALLVAGTKNPNEFVIKLNSDIFNQDNINAVTQLVFYKRGFLTEPCFWFVTSLMSVDPSGQLRQYLSSHKDFLRGIKITTQIKKQSPSLKIELLTLLELFPQSDIPPTDWIELLETEAQPDGSVTDTQVKICLKVLDFVGQALINSDPLNSNLAVQIAKSQKLN